MNFKLIDKKLDLFHPLIIVVMVILFLIIAMPMWYIYRQLPYPNIDLYLYIGIGLLSFILGIFLTNYFLKNKFKIFTSENPRTKSFNLNPQKLSIFDSYSKNELIIVSFVSIGILLQVINIALLGSIPLFSATLKAKAATKIWLISYIIFLPSINILLAKYNRKSHYLLLIIGLALFALTGYRTTPIGIMLSSLITLYYSRDVDLKYIILAILAIVIVLLAVGFIAVQAISWQHWSLNPIELLSYRAAFTLNVLSKAITNQCATMGKLLYTTLTGFFTHSDARVLVGQATLGRAHSITSTIFGPALLDFGILGMIVQMFLIALILKTLHTIQNNKKSIFTAFYSILLGQTIIWIETGPSDVVVYLFYLIGILLIIKTLWRLDNGV
ncbi:oligosaccharide repeat unit polymerase family protein [Methanobrevibacter olleyae]|uniref:Oligosaccharide repeat unit polymerase n=1 Tax=Methanobrevibacter olleyae TaxID=294671 RepID=A0A126R1G2_METOL|nr:oligosaccharide repeat unit polymerase family protein [Methanobrevibacter olleyae]AMK16220.1 oligosaccharide repeat unit polymerase [Methanobrevibacter olleyae]SFL60530.1 oligosaccharide repeat unit polymerase [Methanobrevibacter olleyae]